MADRVVLIVEDEPTIGEMIESVLNDEAGCRATAVPDGAAALAYLAGVVPDLVVLDVNLPGLDGFALHDLLHARPATATVPVLFMTAGGHEAEFARRGVADWLAKPFDLDDLLQRVAAALGACPARLGE